jgi:diguanylate cyclase (GGDEF)-like protein
MRFLLALLVLIALPLGTARALDPDKALHHHVRGNWSIQQGLPQISVLAITQDRTGYLWIGTQAGLARFDGARFTAYTPESEPGLPGTWIRSLLTARDGRLWIGTYKGVAVHDGRGFRRVERAAPDGAPPLDVTGMTEDARGDLYVTATSGVFVLRDGVLVPVPGGDMPVQAPFAHEDGLWIGGRGVVHRRRVTGRWESLALPPEAADATVTRLVSAQGRLWAATSMGLFRLGPTGWEPADEVPQLRQSPVDLLYVDRDGDLWAGGDAGLARLRGGRLAAFVGYRDPGGIPGLRTAFEDREGNLWLGSQWEGLTRLWNSWTRRYSLAEGLHDRIVWSVAPDPDGRRMWVGGNDGLSLLESGRFRLVVPGAALPHPHAYNLLAEPGRVWIGTRGGLRVLDEGTAFPRALPELAAVGGAQVNALRRAPDGALWIGTAEGLFRLRDGALRRFDADDGLADPRVRYLLVEPDGGVLAGTQNGLFAMRGERFVRVGGDGLPATLDVTSILRLRDGRLAVGTLDERTYVGDGRRWRVLDAAQGVPANAPFFLSEHAGYLWMAGIRGISRVPLADLDGPPGDRPGQLRGEMLLNERGDPMSGQQGYCCNGAGTSKGVLVGSTMWLPTRDGVVALDTSSIRKNATPPGVAVERVQLGREWTPAWAIDRTPLPDGVRDLSIDFTAISFQDPKSVRLQYRLRGYDADWVESDGAQRTARYTNLPPGDYVFEVRGYNNAGVPARAPAMLRFSVPPRFHETAWFAALCALAVAAVVYAGYRVQRVRYQRRQAELEGLVEQRTEALALANRQLEEASHTDPLTGLRNRRYIGTQLPADLSFYDRQARARLGDDKAMLFALVDIDHFKHVNDRYGHRAGDLVLQQFAQVLSRLVRTGDYVARWGGEEFLLVFRPMPQRDVATIGERIRSAVVGHAFDLGNGMVLPLTCSIGLSQYPIAREDGAQLGWESMIELADEALYFVKTHGRDGWAAFHPTATTALDTVVRDVHADVHAMLEAGTLDVTGEIGGEPIARRPAEA